MFRHQGKSRTLKHNLQIATVLSFVAGLVNVTGFLAIQQLTTNVTGHFAQFMFDVEQFEFWKGTVYLVYIISFLLGSFSSSFIIEKFRESKKMNVFAIPTIAEAVILMGAATMAQLTQMQYPNALACLLLFAMGMQNSFVTKISDEIVRTTHLTGLFTDLGIEISHLFFPNSYPDKKENKAKIKLRGFIISFFFLGGIVGGFCYASLKLEINTLIIGALVLLLSLFYDDLRFSLIKKARKRKFRNAKQ
ncbi:YoaK family protein [Aequorivita marina]|uniref:YoaK family protein n=1 Tax=Aequorivita marina TaxID=3073654 RepID=UPI002876B1F4|nr:YoaK family protein [Aequorivita sp. S2608]MDS1297793.1 YoaK family protein [Aequorivita sp. S2608]